VVEIQLFTLKGLAAILAQVFVALENIAARQLELLARQLVEERQENDPRQTNRPIDRANRLKLQHRRIVMGEIDPVQNRKRPKVVLRLVHHLRLTPGEQRKSPFGADDINRLPERFSTNTG